MPAPNLAFAKTDVPLKSAPIRAEWIIDGDPVARNCVIGQSQDRMATTLVWDCTAGRFKWIYDVDETIHILEGTISLTGVDGATKTLHAGDVVFFPAGSSATWQVHDHVRKLAFFRQPVPGPVSLFLRAVRKAVGIAGGKRPGMAMAGCDAAPAPAGLTGVQQPLMAFEGVQGRLASAAKRPVSGSRFGIGALVRDLLHENHHHRRRLMGIALAFQNDATPLSNPDLDWLAGRTIVHKIVVGLTDPAVCTIAILQEFGRTAGEIRSLALKPTQADHFEVVLQATSLSAEAARELVGRIAAHPQVKSAAIEHMLIR